MLDDATETLDRSVRNAVNGYLTPGDVVVSWVTIAGVRNPDGGGYVITVCSDDVPPLWQLRGMLAEAEAGISRSQMINELEDSTED